MFNLAANVGKLVRGLGLGLLLIIAILCLLAVTSDIPVFRYQGF